MAIVGARPATGIGIVRRRPRIRARPAVRARTRARRVARSRGTASSISTVLVAIAAAVGLCLFYLTQSTHVAALGYQIDGLQARVANLQAEQQQLTFEIGIARSPSTIAVKAQNELRLVPLDPSVVRFATRSIDQTLLK
jgi:cell division protein FtsB